MTCCDVSFPSPAENLACDEALLQRGDQGLGGEMLRFWEPSQHFVVVGYGNRIVTEVNLAYCRQHSVPVLRRCTGGGTILQGPGVLNYSLILSSEVAPFTTITAANQAILECHRGVMSILCGAAVEAQGQTDLAIADRKFSGNAQRRGRRFLLFHGSFMLDLDLALVEQALRLPSRQPAYRRGRSHADFLVNLKIPASRIKTALREAWSATDLLDEIPGDAIATLVREKYGRDEWNSRF